MLTLAFACSDNKQKDQNQIDNSKKATHQMTALEQLKSILNEQYESEDGYE